MKTATEMRETAQSALRDIAGSARKTAYAMVGAPVVAGRRLGEYRHKLMDGARREFDRLSSEGEKFTEELRERGVVTEIKEKVDLDHFQDRVEKLRDQLEDVLASWRESFRPHETEKAAAEEPVGETAAAEKPAAKSATAKKTAAKKAASPKPDVGD